MTGQIPQLPTDYDAIWDPRAALAEGATRDDRMRVVVIQVLQAGISFAESNTRVSRGEGRL